MSDWREHIAASKAQADDVPVDWSRLTRAIHAAESSRRRRFRWALASAVVGAAALVLVTALLLIPRDSPDIQKPEPAARFDGSDVDGLVSRCGASLDGGVVNAAGTASPDRDVAAAVVRTETDARLCIAKDPGEVDAYILPVVSTPILQPRRVKQTDWALARVPGTQVYVLALNVEHVLAIQLEKACQWSHPSPSSSQCDLARRPPRQRRAKDGTLLLIIVESKDEIYPTFGVSLYDAQHRWQMSVVGGSKWALGRVGD